MGISVFWKNKELIKNLTVREIAQKYKTSYLGLIWAIINPLILLVIYSTIFGVIFKAKWDVQLSDSNMEFAITLFAGLITFNIFSESLSKASGIIVNNANLVKKVVFPLEILSISSILSVLFQAIINFTIFIIGLLVFIHKINLMLLLYPIVILPLIFMSLGCSWLVSALAVYIRDTGQICTVVIQILFYVTPIFYSINIVPEPLRKVMSYNILVPIIDNARNVLLYGVAPDWKIMAIVTVISIFIMVLGYLFFMKTKNSFADVI